MINFLVSEDKITIDDLEMLEGNLKASALKNFVAKFVVDDKDNFLPEDEARKLIGALTLKQAKDAFEQLANKIKEMQNKAVSPTTGIES